MTVKAWTPLLAEHDQDEELEYLAGAVWNECAREAPQTAPTGTPSVRLSLTRQAPLLDSSHVAPAHIRLPRCLLRCFRRRSCTLTTTLQIDSPPSPQPCHRCVPLSPLAWRL